MGVEDALGQPGGARRVVELGRVVRGRVGDARSGRSRAPSPASGRRRRLASSSPPSTNSLLHHALRDAVAVGRVGHERLSRPSRAAGAGCPRRRRAPTSTAGSRRACRCRGTRRPSRAARAAAWPRGRRAPRRWPPARWRTGSRASCSSPKLTSPLVALPVLPHHRELVAGVLVAHVARDVVALGHLPAVGGAHLLVGCPARTCDSSSSPLVHANVPVRPAEHQRSPLPSWPMACASRALALLLCGRSRWRVASARRRGTAATTPRAPDRHWRTPPCRSGWTSRVQHARIDERLPALASSPTTPADDRSPRFSRGCGAAYLAARPAGSRRAARGAYQRGAQRPLGLSEDSWYGRGPPWEDLPAVAGDWSGTWRAGTAAGTWSGTSGTSPNRPRLLGRRAAAVLPCLRGGQPGAAGRARARRRDRRGRASTKYSPEYLLRLPGLLPAQALPGLDSSSGTSCSQPYRAHAARSSSTWSRRAPASSRTRAFGRSGCARSTSTSTMGLSDRYFPAETVSATWRPSSGAAPTGRRAAAGPSPSACRHELARGRCSPDGTPRAAWWVHRWYAEGAAARVASTSSTDAVAALASAAGGSAQVLLGHVPLRAGAPAAPRPGSTGAGTSAQSGTRAASPAEAATDGGSDDAARSRVRLELTGLPQSLRAAGRLRVVARRVPSAGRQAGAPPPDGPRRGGGGAPRGPRGDAAAAGGSTRRFRSR